MPINNVFFRLSKYVPLVFAVTLLSLNMSAISYAQSSEFEKCKAIQDGAARLKCFDTLSEQLAKPQAVVPVSSEMPEQNRDEVSSEIASTQLSANEAPPARELDDIEKRARALMSKSAQSEDPFSEARSRIDASKPGVNRPSVDDFGKEKDDGFGSDTFRTNQENEIEQIQTSVAALKESSRGFYTFTLSNGQVWRQTEVSNGRYKQGDIIEIEKGMFGSFYVNKLDSNRTTRIKRIK